MGRIGVASGVEARHPGSQQVTQAPAPVTWAFRPALDQRTPTTAHSQLSTTWSGGVRSCFGRCVSFAQAKAPKQHSRVRASNLTVYRPLQKAALLRERTASPIL